MSKPETVDDYIDSFAAPAREQLIELRELSRSAAPADVEGLKWGAPAYSHAQGTILFMFSGHKEHANFVFTPSTREAFADELEGFKTGKGSVQLPYDRAVPTDLLTRMIAYRLGEFETNGVKWM